MFMDTSGLFCMYDVRDRRQPVAENHYLQAQQIVTTNYVLTEFVALAHARGVARANALKILRDLAGVPRVEVVWIDERLHEAAMVLLEARLDKSYSLCSIRDCAGLFPFL
ncbi:MAG: type II toxin-antitoxin system VapC family toxin [Blastocatellia bacterium]